MKVWGTSGSKSYKGVEDKLEQLGDVGLLVALEEMT